MIFKKKLCLYLCSFGIRADDVLVCDVDVVVAAADGERFVLKIFAMPVGQLVEKALVLRHPASPDVADLTQLDDVALAALALPVNEKAIFVRFERALRLVIDRVLLLRTPRGQRGFIEIAVDSTKEVGDEHPF